MLAAEVADGILLREDEILPLEPQHEVHPGPADSSIFNTDPSGTSVARSMRAARFTSLTAIEGETSTTMSNDGAISSRKRRTVRTSQTKEE